MTEAIDFERRFGGVKRLYGESGLAKLQATHVVVIGIGGVGSWAAEALARSAVGNITLVDLDHIAESNVNRQIHAVEDNFGMAKVMAMAKRIHAINPACIVREIEDFVTLQNVSKLLDFKCNVLIDCTDDVQAKLALILEAKAKKIPLIMSGSAGGRFDPTHIKTADLSAVIGDKLLAKVRNLLRRDYDFPKASNTKKSAKFGIACVYSDEPVIKPQTSCETNAAQITGLNCAGYGSSVCVTAPFGFALANLAIQSLIK
jgi:tRNA threonylcarbamoyladenosine dehydratase